MLVSVQISANFHPPGPLDWSNFSIDIEVATKQFHDRLLESLLGKPTTVTSISGRDPQNPEANLETFSTWTFPWGKIVSGHDSRGGNTSITVNHGNRQEEANRAYNAGRR
jgi:hypothetical protein